MYYTGGVAYRGSERRCSASFLKLKGISNAYIP